MLHKCKFGRNLAVMKSTLLLRPEKLLDSITPSIAEGWHVPLSPQKTQLGFIWSKSCCKGGPFTHEAWRVSRPYLASHWRGSLNIHTWHSLPMLHNQYIIGLNRAIKKAALLLKPKQLYVSISPRVAAGWLEHAMWHYIPMRHNQGRFGQSRAVKKGTLLLRPKQFSFSITPRISGWWFKLHTWRSLPIRHNQCKFGRNRAVKATLLLRPEQIFVRLASYYRGVSQTSHVSLPIRAPWPV
jgi:hypothetical protein